RRIWHDYQFREDGGPRANLPCFPQGFGDKVARDHADIIRELISYGFAAFDLSPDSTQKLKDIAIFCVVKDLFLEDVTGLVFAGFGSEDRYPVVITYYVSAMVDGIVKRSEISTDAID